MNLYIVRFCAEEVRRQGRGPLEVAGMVNAWEDALRKFKYGRFMNLEQHTKAVQRWGHLIEPEANEPRRWRSCNVRVGNHICPPLNEVPHLMSRYLDMFPSMNADEAYLEFERIHPFRDGNGRVGKILFNWKNDTMSRPVFPPDFFGGIANP